jgi:hypothetical protein
MGGVKIPDEQLVFFEDDLRVTPGNRFIAQGDTIICVSSQRHGEFLNVEGNGVPVPSSVYEPDFHFRLLQSSLDLWEFVFRQIDILKNFNDFAYLFF